MSANWTLVVSGNGPSHSGVPADAEILATAFVQSLQLAGHKLSNASLQYDKAPDDLIAAAAALPAKAPQP